MSRALILKIQRKLRSQKILVPKGFEATWIAVDPTGRVYVYQQEPIALDGGWGAAEGTTWAHFVCVFVGDDFSKVWKEMKWKIK